MFLTKPPGMKMIALILLASCASLSAELPVMSDKKEWLGYFVGWTGKDSDFGIGSDGESTITPKKGDNQYNTKEIRVQYVIEEKMGGKWVRRKILEEGGLTTENTKGLDPKGPVVFVSTVTGGTKVEWTHVISRGKVNIKPKILEKKTENEVRVGVDFALPKFYRFQDEVPEGRDLKKKVGKDYVKATRLKDRKSVKMKFHEVDKKLTDEDYLEEGASEVEVTSEKFLGKSIFVKNGGPKAGRIDIPQKSPLYNSFRINWRADPEKLGTKDCFLTAWVE